MKYIPYREIVHHLDVEPNDIIFISSDISALAWNAIKNEGEFSATQLISSFMKKITSGGTLLFPTYNWDFCKGVAFDYYETEGKVGSLGNEALKCGDFLRTKHPIYSFAAWGKDAELLYSLDNKSAFSANSPFGYMHKNYVKNICLGTTFQMSYTFVHYVEEVNGGIICRYMKDFTADYIDQNGMKLKKTYSMSVRQLDLDVKMDLNPLVTEFEKLGLISMKTINGVNVYSAIMSDTYDVIKKDVLENNGRKYCSFIGQ